MALQRTIVSNYAKQIRFRKDGSSKAGCGDDKHMLVGATGADNADQMRYRSLLQFPWDWDGIKRVVKIEVGLRVEDDSTHYTLGTKPKVRFCRNTQTWSEGSGAENVWTAGEYQKPAYVGSVEKELAINPSTGLPQDDVWLYVDVTALMKPVVPKGIQMADGSSGGGETNHGFTIRLPGNENDTKQRAIFHSWHTSTPSNRPVLVITYDPVNQPPIAPTLTGPGTTNVTFGDQFTGAHSDPDGDSMAAREVIVYIAGGSTKAWTLPAALQNAGSDETNSGTFSVPLSLAAGSLKLQTAYEWVARTRDPAGLWGPYSARRALKITSSAPTVVATPYTTRSTMVGALFGGTYTDPDGSPLSMFHIQMRSLAGHNDAAFADESLHVWDTGEEKATADEVNKKLVAREYAGQPLAVGSYTYRVKVRDASGVWSSWAYDDFQLTAPFSPDIEDTDLTTQIARIAPVRIALYKMGTLRGRGALIGYVDDPIDLGHSAYLNSGGELYFSLPALHPYCPSIEPHQTHYAVEQFYGDRYREFPEFQGIITDFDADTDSVVFYGTNYLGLLQTAVDERYDPAKAELAANGTGGGGSKYTDKTIDWVLRDQLLYHKGLANSPVGFITVPPVGPLFSALAERVTIYSTYTEALPFIGGLIDSHKQGTGREARMFAKPNATYTAWAWNLIDNWGKDRPNIRLEYGGLLTDFRIVALGDFGTRVLGVGQKRGEVKVFRATGTSNLSEAQWGRRAKTRFYQDIIDQNDLNRRVKEDANTLAKVGKRMALAIRADMLSPFDGWDIGDNILVDIVRGVVDTKEYGSGGYWNIRGVEWRYYPDGHTDLTLTILPKKTATGADPDLIPSINPGVPRHWQVGYGVPKKYGEPPYNTPTLLRDGSINPLVDEEDADPVEAEFFEDLNTGCVYQFTEASEDPEVEDYVLVSCPEEGAPGPPGPPGPAGGAGFKIGEYRWDTARGPDPDAGYARLDSDPVVGEDNLLHVNVLQFGGDNREPYLAQVRAGDILFVDDQLGNIIRVLVSGDPVPPTAPDDWYAFPFKAEATGPEPADNAAITILFDSTGRVDTTPPDPPVWAAPIGPDRQDLKVTTRLAEDGTVVSLIRADWDDLAPGPPNDDFSHFDVLIRPTVLGRPVTWNLTEGAVGSGTFGVGQYTVVVTATGLDGGETAGSPQVIDITPDDDLVPGVATKSIGVTDLVLSTPQGAGPPFRIYVSPSAGHAEQHLAGTTGLDTFSVINPPALSTQPPEFSTALWSIADILERSSTSDYTHMTPDTVRIFYIGIRSVDKAGNSNPPLDPSGDPYLGVDFRGILSARDEIAPPIPAGVRGIDGDKLIGVTWQVDYVNDLSRYEVRWKFIPAGTPIEPPDPDPAVEPYPAIPYLYGHALTNAYSIRVEGDGQVLGHVRAVDRSGNVDASHIPGTGLGPDVKAALEADLLAGWSDRFEAQSSYQMPSELALTELFSQYAYLIELDADQIKSGDIILSPDPDSAGSITIFDAGGTLVGYWSPVGWYLIDGNDPTRAIRGKDAVISYTKAGVEGVAPWSWPEAVWTPALGPDGFNADLITSGSMDGGHNLLLNSAFELAPLSGPKTTILYDTASEWDTAGNMVGTATNKVTGNAALLQSNYDAASI